MTTNTQDSQVLKGVLTMILLRLLSEEESYGYEIVTRLRELGLTDINEGTVYPALTRLEREKSLESRLIASTSGPARKYYRLSSDGLTTLQSAEDGWRALVDTVTPLISKPIPATAKRADQ